MVPLVVGNNLLAEMLKGTKEISQTVEKDGKSKHQCFKFYLFIYFATQIYKHYKVNAEDYPIVKECSEETQ